MIHHHLHMAIVTVIMITGIIVTGCLTAIIATGVLIMTDVIEVLTTIIVIGIDSGLFRCRNGPPLLPVVVSYQNRGECMKKLLITAAVMALFTTPAFAADPAPAATTPEKKEVPAAAQEQGRTIAVAADLAVHGCAAVAVGHWRCSLGAG